MDSNDELRWTQRERTLGHFAQENWIRWKVGLIKVDIKIFSFKNHWNRWIQAKSKIFQIWFSFKLIPKSRTVRIITSHREMSEVQNNVGNVALPQIFSILFLNFRSHSTSSDWQLKPQITRARKHFPLTALTHRTQSKVSTRNSRAATSCAGNRKLPNLYWMFKTF